MRRRRDAARRPVASLEHVERPADGLLTLPYRGERSRDVAHHVHEKRIRRYVEEHPVAVTRDADLRDLAHGRAGLATGRTKR